MNWRTLSGTLITAALAASVLTACSSDSEDSDSSSPSASASDGGISSTGPSKGSSGSAGTGGAKVATNTLTTAEGAVSKGRPFDLEHEHSSSGKRIWEVKVASGTTKQYKVHVSKDGSKVVSKKQDDDVDDDVDKLSKAKLSAANAALRATRDHSGTVDSMEIDTLDSGKVVWEVVLRKDDELTKYKLDADNGKTLRTKQKDD